MVFDVYKSEKICLPYMAVQILKTPESLKNLVSKYSGKYVIVKDKMNRNDCFGGILLEHPSDERKFLLTNPGSLASEEEKLTFNLDNLETIFVK